MIYNTEDGLQAGSPLCMMGTQGPSQWRSAILNMASQRRHSASASTGLPVGFEEVK